MKPLNIQISHQLISYHIGVHRHIEMKKIDPNLDVFAALMLFLACMMLADGMAELPRPLQGMDSSKITWDDSFKRLDFIV